MQAQIEYGLTCPYCAAPISVLVDCSVEQQTYVEDCQVCCQPMVLQVYADPETDEVTVNAFQENE